MLKIAKYIHTGLMAAMAMLAKSNTVYADEMSTERLAYINGGIGQEETDDMRTNASKYNLRM